MSHNFGTSQLIAVKKNSKSQWWVHKSAKFNLPGMKYHSFIYDLWIEFYLINGMDDIRWKFLGFFYMLRYFNFASSFKLRWSGARDLFGSQIPLTTRGFELKISCIKSSYLTHTIAVSNLARSWSISIFCIKFSKFWNCILFVSWSIFFSTTLTLNNFKKKIVSS